jgi:hypothetical protein
MFRVWPFRGLRAAAGRGMDCRIKPGDDDFL